MPIFFLLVSQQLKRNTQICISSNLERKVQKLRKFTSTQGKKKENVVVAVILNNTNNKG
jgi:hypothetical protein